MYNIGGTVIIEGRIDTFLLIQALQRYISSQDAFQIRIVLKDQVPMQMFLDNERQVSYLDFSDYGEEAYKQYKKWEKKQAHMPIEIIDSQLYKFFVFKLNDDVYGYFIKVHHIIADGWSMQLLTNKVHDNYIQLKTDCLTEQTIEYSYKNYLTDERNYIKSSIYEKDRFYWLKLLQKMDVIEKESVRFIASERYSFGLSEQKTLLIRQYCKDHNLSLNSFFVGLYLLHEYQMQERQDIVLGIPVLGRYGRIQRNTFGMFVNTIPFVIHTDLIHTVEELFREVEATLYNGYVHQRYPYNHLVKEKKWINKSLFDICINYYGTAMPETFDGFPVNSTEFYNGQQPYSLQIIIREWYGKNTIQLDIDALITSYSRTQINVLYNKLMELADCIITNTDINLISKQQKMSRVISPYYNDTKKYYEVNITIIDLFEKTAKQYPNRIAVECEGKSFTYSQFRQLIYKVCAWLEAKEISQGTIIGVIGNHSVEMLATIWGILTYGCVFLPIDPKTPILKLSYMVNNAEASILLTDNLFLQVPSYSGNIHFFSNIYNMPPVIGIKNRSSFDKLAYILYTSGSSGQPKGVKIMHKSLLNYIYWASCQYAPAQNEAFALYSSISFDLTITTLFTPLISGGKIIIYPEKGDKHILFKILEDNRCEVIKLTPSHLMLIQDMEISDSVIRRFIVGGEDLKTALALRIYKNIGEKIEIINEYGPTEATVGCMIHLYDPVKDLAGSVPIGKPAWNTQIYVLDENMEEVSIGNQGEIYIAGDGVAQGYINQKELTEEYFLTVHMAEETKRLYRTGDMAKFIDPCTLVYCGRLDSQVKIRGHRIELQEIEAAMEQHPKIDAAHVSVIVNQKGIKQLCGYYIAKYEILEKELISFLHDFLHHYMIPSWFLHIECFPLTGNGKLDAGKLPVPSSESISKYSITDHPLLMISADILGVSNLLLDDNFYHLGGDSISATQISSKLQRIGYLLTIQSILENPVFRDMENKMIQMESKSLDQGVCIGEIKKTPIINWFFTRPFQKQNAYCLELQLRFKFPVPAVTLEKALHTLVMHHDMLRANINQNNRLFYNAAHLNTSIEVNEYDCTLDERMEEELIQQVKRELWDSMDLTGDLFLRSSLFHTQSGIVWCIIIHHLAVDGVSLRILLDDLSTILRNLLQGQQINLPFKTMSYQSYASNLNQTDNDFNYPVFTLGTGIPVKQQIAIWVMDECITHILCQKANKRYSTKPAELLLTGLLQTLYGFSNTHRWVLEIEGHNRNLNGMDVSRTVGWFTSLMQNPIEGFTNDMEASIIWCKEMYRKMLNGGVLTRLNTKDNHQIVRFNFLGEFHSNYNLFTVDPVFPLLNEIIDNIEFDSMIYNKKLHICIRICKEIYTNLCTANDILSKFIKNLNEILDFCCQSNEINLTPSDFSASGLLQKDLDSIFI